MVSQQFKQTIGNYLKVRANTDELFAEAFAKKGKNLDECCNYILQKVKESGQMGFDDDEIYSLAVDYYDEDDIDPKYLKPISCKVVTNAHIDKPKPVRQPKPTPAKPVQPKPKKASKNENTQQLTLF